MRFACLFHRQYMADLRMQLAFRDPRLHGLQAARNEIAVLGQDAEPKSMGTETSGHHDARIELVPLAGGGSVDDHASKSPTAAQALGGVLAAEHFEDRIHAFALGQLLYPLLVIDLAIVNRVVQAKLPDALQLLVR